MNKVNATINSRTYTVVAEEDTAYLERLCKYVSDKVNQVISEGSHVMGEKPVVLAALNICDEYFKLLDRGGTEQTVPELLMQNRELQKELSMSRDDETGAEERILALEEEIELCHRMNADLEEKIKTLEGQINDAEMRLRKQRGEFAIREREILDMLESK